jgi:hypothetical protein
MGMLIMLPAMHRNMKEKRYSGGIPNRLKAHAKRPNCTRAKTKNRRKTKPKRNNKRNGGKNMTNPLLYE